MMEAAMPRPIRITTPIEPLETRIKRLRIPKARQKELWAMMDEAWARLAKEKQAATSDTVKQEEKLQNAWWCPISALLHYGFMRG
jgi:hypothetical protein